MYIKFQKLHRDVELGDYAHPGDAGIDLRSYESKVLAPLERYAFATGLSLEIPEGFVGLVWDRSGLAVKEGLTCLAGVVDSGYRGEIKIVMLNTSDKEVKIEKGDRIAQMLIQPIMKIELEPAKKLSQTERGKGGFGASGKK